MIGFGGHQAAAGVHVELSKLGTLRDLFAGACERFPLPDCATVTHPVAEVRLAPEDSLADVVRDCARFEPCGHGNRAPRIVLERARVRRARPVGQGHLRLDLDSTFGPLRGFGIDLAAAAPAVGSVVHVTGKLRNDTYGGAGAVEIFVEAITDAASEES